MPQPPTAVRHLVIPYAASLSGPCEQALQHLRQEASQGRLVLPQLARLLGRLMLEQTLEGDEYALNMPHERLLGQTLDWPNGGSGGLPWVDWWARRDGITLAPDLPWALLSPGHWLMGREHLTLLDPEGLGLDADTSQRLLEAVRPFFEEDGWTLQWGAPTRWYASHAELDGLTTASLDRVTGRNPDLWLDSGDTPHPLSRRLRRLQAEVQMLLYQHPVNDAREAAGLRSINSFWVSGAGRLPLNHAQPLPESLCVAEDLRAGLLSDDMPQWMSAWQTLDAGPLAELNQALDAGTPVRLSLCGERHARTWALARDPAASLLQRVWNGRPDWLRRPATVDVADTLSQL